MKKGILFLTACALIFASCESDSNDSIQNQQAQIDSVAKAKATLQDAINQKRNDSTINAMAATKADSIQKADAKTKEHTATPKTTIKDSAAHAVK